MGCGKKTESGCCNQLPQKAVDYLVCTCMGVMYSDICDAINDGAHTFEELSQRLGVGTGCGSCVQEVHQILQSRLKTGCCKS